MRTPREPDYVLDAHRVGKELSVEITRERTGRAGGGRDRWTGSVRREAPVH